VQAGGSQLGTPSVVTVSDGRASTTLRLPAGLSAGGYTILTRYAGSTGFAPSDAPPTQLKVTPAATTTITPDTAVNMVARSTGSVSLSANVASSAGLVSSGKVNFVLRNGGSVIGSPVSGEVVAGAANVVYPLPVDVSAGNLTIEAVYQGTNDFLTSVDDSTLNVTRSKLPTTLTTNPTTVTFRPTEPTVNLTTKVTGANQTVGSGTVTFTVFDGTQQLGSAVTVGLTQDTANAIYSLALGNASRSVSGGDRFQRYDGILRIANHR
jgi:hypothetical protein